MPDVVGRRHISPTQAARASRCLHAWHLECHGDAAEKVAPDAGTLQLIAAGQAWERRCFEQLAAEGAVEVPWDGKDWAAGHAATEALMREGARWIYQPVLVRDDVRGRPDLLRRVRGRSLLGSYTYEPVDVKSHRQVSPKDRVQLRVCAHLLESILGRKPRRGGIWLSTGEIATVKLDGAAKILASMRDVRDRRVPTEAVRCGECDVCPWTDHCWREWESARHCTLIGGATGGAARKLLRAGLATIDSVAGVAPERLAQDLGLDDARAVRLHCGALAWVTRRPVLLARPAWPKRTAAHFYDIETFGETVYLHGLVSLDGDGTTVERQTLASTLDDERRAWHEFLEIVAALPDGPIYTWTKYERGHAVSLWSRHGGDERGYARLTRDLTDLCAIVRDHYALPASTFGLKDVAPVFGFAWQAEDAGGLAAGAWYAQCLAAPDDALLRKVCEYNLDDVRAMVVVYRKLRALA